MRKARKIIIAEDQLSEYQLMKEAFYEEAEGLDIVHVCNGQDLFTYLDEESLSQVALVLLNLDIPDTDGLEVLKKLYEDEELRKVPVVVYSSEEDSAQILKCYDEGANAYIRKPKSPEEYRESVHAIANFWTEINVLPGYNKVAH